MSNHPQRIHVDTAVIGGCLDGEFADASRRLLDLARQGKMTFLISDLPVDEFPPRAAASIRAPSQSDQFS